MNEHMNENECPTCTQVRQIMSRCILKQKLGKEESIANDSIGAEKVQKF